MSVGKPDAGNQHVRFDERGRETERGSSEHSHRARPQLYQNKTRLAGASSPAARQSPHLHRRPERQSRLVDEFDAGKLEFMDSLNRLARYWPSGPFKITILPTPVLARGM